jgi:hypothetical protein
MSLDIDTFKDRTVRLSLDGIDLDAFRDEPLDAGTLRCLRFMHDVENHTVCYLRDLLLTPSHQDPRITTFLTMWNFEEFWHGEAIGRVLEAHGEPGGEVRIRAMRRRLGVKDRFRPFFSTVGSALAGEDFVATHMTWGAINEWSTHAGYTRLVDRAQHPVLTELLSRIMRQESRHIAFYASEAARRLAASSRARKVTRFALRQFWSPVGAGVMPRTETAFLIDWLFSGSDGERAARRIDANVSRLPGLDGLTLVSDAGRRYAAQPVAA